MVAIGLVGGEGKWSWWWMLLSRLTLLFLDLYRKTVVIKSLLLYTSVFTRSTVKEKNIDKKQKLLLSYSRFCVHLIRLHANGE